MTLFIYLFLKIIKICQSCPLNTCAEAATKLTYKVSCEIMIMDYLKVTTHQEIINSKFSGLPLSCLRKSYPSPLTEETGCLLFGSTYLEKSAS